MHRSSCALIALVALLPFLLGPVTGCKADSSKKKARKQGGGTGTGTGTGGSDVQVVSLASGAQVGSFLLVDTPFALFELTALTGDVSITGIGFSSSGTSPVGNGGSFSEMRLYQDDGDGSYSAANDALLGTVAGGFGTDYTGNATFTVNLAIANGASIEVWLVFDLDGNGFAGDTFTPSLTGITGTVNGSAAGATGTPAAGPTTTLFMNDHLLITEYSNTLSTSGGDFVEIFNATAQTVDLSDYYLSDAGHTIGSNTTFYYLLSDYLANPPADTPRNFDFIGRFPDGASIGPGEFQTVSLGRAASGSTPGFDQQWATSATYYLVQGVGALATPPRPDMREAYTGSIPNHATQEISLTNSREMVVLFHWDGVSDLVEDVDYLVYAEIESQRDDAAMDKTPVTVGSTPYQADTAVTLQDYIEVPNPNLNGASGFPAPGSTSKRIDFTEGNEITATGNGITGNDETSEDFSNTWLAYPDPAASPPSPNEL